MDQLLDRVKLTLAAIVFVVIVGWAILSGGDDDPVQNSAQKQERRASQAKFTGAAKSARIVARQAYGAGPDGKTDEGVQLVRRASCTTYSCTIALRPEGPVVDVERELLEGSRPLFRRLFRLKSLDVVTLEIYGKTTSIGGKKGVKQVAELTCDRSAHGQIDWENVGADGLKALCAWSPLVRMHD